MPPSAPLIHAILALSCLSSNALNQDPTCPAAPLFDCNGNGVEDAIDIAVGTSVDRDCNGIPDECESPPPARRMFIYSLLVETGYLP